MQYEFELSNLRQQLLSSLSSMGINITATTVEQLLAYLAVLWKWNKVHNLVAPCSPQQMLSRHFLDSLALLPYLSGKIIVDLGTGGGFPGLVLAIADPSKQFILLDSKRKKINFVQHVIATLGVNNALAVNSRAEAYHPESLADMLITRAVTSIDQLLTLGEHLCHKNSLFVMMKGRKAVAMQEKVPNGFKIVNMQEITVPGVAGERCVVVLGRA